MIERTPAQAKQPELRLAAEAMGINHAYISTLVDTFYGHVRTDAKLGPIFLEAIGEDWDPHLSRMKQFWASVSLSTGEFSGQPVPVHRKHEQIAPEHFDVWLELFERTLKETAPSAVAVEYFMVRARRIATSLQLAIFGVPELGPPQ